MPVHIVKLKLPKFHLLPISIQESPDDFYTAMGRETKVPDSAILLLFHQVFENTKLGVQIIVDIPFIYIVKQVEIKVRSPALF